MNDRDSRIIQAMRKKIVKRLVLLGIVLVIAGGLTLWLVLYLKNRERNLPGVLYPDAGRRHIPVGTQGVGYNSNPPTSGEHYPHTSEWGAYREETPDGILIHNLEHGGIWISYKPSIPEEMKQKLEGFSKKWGRKIIVVPRSANDTDIALAAWARLDTFSVAEYSDERVERFIRAHRNKGPEFVP